jgi:hypothetical protein
VSPVYTFGGRKEEEVRSTYRQIYGLIPTGDENAAPVIGSFFCKPPCLRPASETARCTARDRRFENAASGESGNGE